MTAMVARQIPAPRRSHLLGQICDLYALHVEGLIEQRAMDKTAAQAIVIRMFS